MNPITRLKAHGFFSLPKEKAGWLRLPLTALAAYFVTIEAMYLLGREIPLGQRFSTDVTVIYPFVLFIAISTIALFVKRRLGIVFTLIWLLLVVAAAFTPAR